MDFRGSRGVSLVEVMVSVALLSIGALAFIGAYSGINRALQNSRMRTVATNLAQEEVEYLKNFSYYTLLVTTSTLPNSNFNPTINYDNSNYPPKTFSYWGASLTRAVEVQYAVPINGQITGESSTANDPGLKMITVWVWWNDGANWQKVQMQNLLENPNVSQLNSQITGYVYNASAGNLPLPGAIVSVLGSPQWNAQSALDGSYGLTVAAGSYTVTASSVGFYAASSALLSASATSPASQNFYLGQIASGTVIAQSVYFSSHALISQIVADTNTVVGDGTNQDVQYIELFNPTTSVISIASDISGPGCSNPVTALLQINYLCGNGSSCNSNNINNIPLCYISSVAVPGSYYLIANTTESFVVSGASVAPDAYYKSNYYPAESWTSTELIQTTHVGAVQLVNSAGSIVDGVGWSNTSNGHNPTWALGHPIPQPGGIKSGNQIVRMSSPCAVVPGLGRAYDTQDNANNFGYDTGLGYFLNPAYDTISGAQTIISGDPAIGGYASSNDGLSSVAVISSVSLPNPFDTSLSCLYADLNLTNVATGTWTVVVATGAYEQSISSVTVAYSGQTVPVLNLLTVPVSSFAPVGFLPISSPATGGYISGMISVSGNPLNGISVSGPNGTALSNPAGLYFASSDTGTAISITANPNQTNPLYVSQNALVNVFFGQVTTQNFSLSQGGEITGYATSGLSVLPAVVFVASDTANSQSGVSDNTGHFYIANLSTGTYTVTPQLNSGQISNPPQVSVNLVGAGSAVFSASFTVSGTMGVFTGNVSAGGNPVTTGVIIIASTVTLSYPPPNIAGSSSSPIYYATSSQPDGTYSLSVRGSNSSNTYSYNLLAIYSIADENSGVVTIVSQSQSGSVNAGQSSSVNFTGL